MNKIKYGDKVTITDGEFKGITGEIVSKVNYISCTVMTDKGTFIANVSDVTPYSPTPDMLAIPDDHVFQVEWRKIDNDGMYNDVIVSDGQYTKSYIMPTTGTTIKNHGYTHYLTEADLLKLPFKK